MPELVRVTIVANEQEAELARGLLQAEGIDSMHRITNFSFGSGGELPASGVGPRELLVREEDYAVARELLTSLDAT
ncbi:MAG: hypothetical protein JWN72_330 [Thermoleophilia bacterium]|nr:hypothetical protein [Thermoleophilia bacterium]